MSEQRIGRYLLKNKIATGGMAEIWFAQQAGVAGFQKDLVIKRILPHIADDQAFVEMFLDEARLAAKLSHPNIVQIFDLGESNGDYYIAMEYIDGYDLENIVERAVQLNRPIHSAIIARIIADACVGLAHAHEFVTTEGVHLKLVHRDISPQNILVSKNGIVKIVDFGVAKAATSQHKTQTGAVKGKLSYMSPEQIAGKNLDGRSDLFALGIVLYELLTNLRPFGHESELMAVTAIMGHQPQAPSNLVLDLPVVLEQIVLKALEKDVIMRFSNAREMQRALEHYLLSAGILLSQQDVADYIKDLFSEHPTGMIPALQNLRPSGNPAKNTIPTNIRGGSTAPQPKFETEPNQSDQWRQNASSKTQFNPSQPEPPQPDPPQPDPPQPKKGKFGLFLALFIMLLVFAGAGFFFVTEVLPIINGETESEIVAENDEIEPDQEDPTELAQNDQTQENAQNPEQNPNAQVNGENAQEPKPNEQENGQVNTQENAQNPEQLVETSPEVEADVGVATNEVPIVETSPEVEADVGVATNEVPIVETSPEVEADVGVATNEVPIVEEEAEPEPARIRFTGERGQATINGDRRGRVPATYEVEPGTVRIRVDGSNRRIFTDRVRVREGETERVRVRY